MCRHCLASAAAVPRGPGMRVRSPGSCSQGAALPACGGRRGAGGDGALCLVNSLAGLLGLRPSLRSNRADACCPPSAGRASAPECGVCVPPAPGLELLVVPSPAEMATWGPAPQEGFQLVRRPLAPALLAVLAALALLVLAPLLGRLFFLLRSNMASPGRQARAPTPTAPGRGGVYLLVFLLLLLLLLGGRPALLVCRGTQGQLPSRPARPPARPWDRSLGNRHTASRTSLEAPSSPFWDGSQVTLRQGGRTQRRMEGGDRPGEHVCCPGGAARACEGAGQLTAAPLKASCVDTQTPGACSWPGPGRSSGPGRTPAGLRLLRTHSQLPARGAALAKGQAGGGSDTSPAGTRGGPGPATFTAARLLAGLLQPQAKEIQVVLYSEGGGRGPGGQGRLGRALVLVRHVGEILPHRELVLEEQAGGATVPLGSTFSWAGDKAPRGPHT